MVQDLLEYAFQAKIFASDRIKEPRDIWLYTDVPEQSLSVLIHIKETMRDIPIFHPMEYKTMKATGWFIQQGH